MDLLKDLKLSTKLWGLTGLLLLAVLFVAGNAMVATNGILKSNGAYTAVSHSNTFMAEKVVDHYRWLKKIQDLFLSNASTLEVQMDHTRCGLGQFIHGEQGRKLAALDPELATLLESLKVPHQHLHESATHIRNAWQPNHPGLSLLLAARLDDHRRWAGNLTDALLKGRPIRVESDPGQCAFGKWLADEETRRLISQWPEFGKLMEKIKPHHTVLHQSVSAIQQAASQAEKTEIYATSTVPALEEVARLFGDLQKLEANLDRSQAEARRIFETETLPALSATQAALSALKDRLGELEKLALSEMTAKGSRSKTVAGVVTLLALAIGAVLGLVVIRSIIRPINRVVSGLSQGANQVASVAGQVSGASHELAEGASEQAASIEESSASLEEMSAMTKQNADNATHADALMKEAYEVVQRADQSMNELTRSMEDISGAGEKTAKIIQTIDEIAFQTNLLALNAAVEAARAGEAGAGFAVVAEEVRGLALRAANAARDTSGLIEDTMNKTQLGANLVTRTNDEFLEVTTSAEKVGRLVSEIAAASKEQAQGVNQINIAISQMDKVTQRNAANAEESAAASEEMSAQAEQMMGMVGDMITLVGNGKNSLG